MTLFTGRAESIPQAAQDDQALIARARQIHERAITLDTHNDIETNTFTPECNYTMRLTTQVNLPKMKEGGMDVSFMVVYTAQGALTPEGYANAYQQAIAKFDAVHRVTEQIAPKEIGLALTPDDVRKIVASGRKAAVIGVENGYPLGTDLERVKEFYDRGGRYLSLAHNGHNQLADSNTGEATNTWTWGGVSPLGRQVIAELNRWGVMVDVSHPSKGAIMQSIALSKAPVIASHSAVRALADHQRNMDDELLTAVKQNGGVVQIVALASFVVNDPPGRAAARTAAMAKLREDFSIPATTGRAATAAPTTTPTAAPATGARGGGGRGRGQAAACPVEDPNTTARGRRAGAAGGATAATATTPTTSLASLTPEQRSTYERRLARINAEYPAARRATLSDFVDHIEYAVKLIGIDHVGIASDFDGGGGVDGYNSAADAFNVTLELVKRGYTEEQISKLWGGNLLRVWQEVIDVAKKIQAGTIK